MTTQIFKIYCYHDECDISWPVKLHFRSKAVQPAEDQQRQDPATPLLTSLTQVTASDTVAVVDIPNASVSVAAQKSDLEESTGDDPLSDLPAISSKKPDSEDFTGNDPSPELPAFSAVEQDLEESTDDYPPPEIPASEKLVLGVTHVDQDCVIYGQEIKKGNTL